MLIELTITGGVWNSNHMIWTKKSAGDKPEKEIFNTDHIVRIKGGSLTDKFDNLFYFEESYEEVRKLLFPCCSVDLG